MTLAKAQHVSSLLPAGGLRGELPTEAVHASVAAVQVAAFVVSKAGKEPRGSGLPPVGPGVVRKRSKVFWIKYIVLFVAMTNKVI